MWQIEKLNNEQKQLVMDAPALVTLLIGNSDGNMAENELQRAMEVVDIKSNTEFTEELKKYYLSIKSELENRLQHWMNILPTDPKERVKIITYELSKINEFWNEIEPSFTTQLYNSWRQIAVHVANASGGVLGIGAINSQEKEVLHLPFLNNPSEISEE